jgi:hypothetical protein
LAAGPERTPVERHAWDVPLLGITTRFESNDPAVIALARDALEAWNGESTPVASQDAPVLVRIDVEEDGRLDHGGPVALRYHTADHRVTITGIGVRAEADHRSRRAHARVARAVVDQAEHFRYGILEALALFILSHQDRQPLHAAGIARGDAVLLLVGPAGVGKSTLTYSALRAGYRVFAEDVVWLQLRPALRVWGLARRIHLPPDAAERFPELAGRPVSLVAGGEPKIVVPVEGHHRSAAPCTTAAAVCLMGQRDVRASLRPLHPAEVRRALTPTESGFVIFADTIGPALDALAAPGGWRLTPSPALDDAIPLLDRMLNTITPRRA